MNIDNVAIKEWLLCLQQKSACNVLCLRMSRAEQLQSAQVDQRTDGRCRALMLIPVDKLIAQCEVLVIYLYMQIPCSRNGQGER